MSAVVPRAIAQMFSAKVLSMLFAVGGMAVLARLLSPDDFGVFAFGMAAFGVAGAISQFGLMERLVSRETLDDDELAAAYGLAVTLALVLTAITSAIVYASSGTLDRDVLPVTLLLGGALVADAIATPFEARRRRDIRFRFLASLTVAQSLVELAAGITLALLGFGATSLAAGVFASRATAAVALSLAAPGGRRLRPRFSGWGRFRRFGGIFVIARLLPRAGELVVVSLITRGLGVRPLGLYNRAGAVHSIPDRTVFEAINPVVLPALTKALRDDVRPGRLYIDKVDYLAAVCWPAFAAIAVLADPMVSVLLGSQWSGAVEPVRILAITGLFMPLTKMSMKLFIAVDRIDLHLRSQVATVIATVVGVAIGSTMSLEAVCLGLVAAQVVQTTFVWRGVRTVAVGALRVPWTTLGRNAIVTAATIAPVGAALWLALPDVLVLLVAVAGGGIGWLVALSATGHRLGDELRELMRSDATSPEAQANATPRR